MGAAPAAAAAIPERFAAIESTREWILAALEEGPVHDERGYATRLLIERMGWAKTASAITQQLARLEHEGRIERTMVGKLCRRIAIRRRPLPVSELRFDPPPEPDLVLPPDDVPTEPAPALRVAPEPSTPVEKRPVVEVERQRPKVTIQELADAVGTVLLDRAAEREEFADLQGQHARLVDERADLMRRLQDAYEQIGELKRSNEALARRLARVTG